MTTEIQKEPSAPVGTSELASPSGIELIAAERERQISKEGWTHKHDDQHADESMAAAAACLAAPRQIYAMHETKRGVVMHDPFPWGRVVRNGRAAHPRLSIPMNSTNTPVRDVGSSDSSAPTWTQNPPTEQGEYWHWNGDEDCAPSPMFVLWSGHTGKCFVSRGQLGIEHAIDCDQYGGWWMPLYAPPLPNASHQP